MYYIDEDGKFTYSLKERIGCNPNTGVIAMTHLLSLDIKTLTVVGFDFYQTLYLNIENENLRNDIINNKTGNWNSLPHNPSKQLKFIKDFYYKDKRFIPMGVLKKLLENV